MNSIAEKAWEGERLSKKEGLLLWERADFYTLATLAHNRRVSLHPEAVVTYVSDLPFWLSLLCLLPTSRN